MFTRSFEVRNGDCVATVTVRTEDGAAFLDRQMTEVALGIYEKDSEGKAAVSIRERYHREQFAAAFAWSTVEGDLGFPWPETPFDSAALLKACAAWLGQPGGVVKEWLLAMNEVDQDMNDPDLLPPENVEKKDSKSRKS